MAATHLPAQQPVRPGFPAPLHITASPAHVTSVDGRDVLVYELRLINLGTDTVWVRSLEIRSGDERIHTVSPSQWTAVSVGTPSAPDDWVADGLVASPGQHWTVYLWIPDPPAPIGPVTHHILAYDGTHRGANALSVVAPTVMVGRPPLVIDPPVRGGIWLPRNGFGPGTNHRRFFSVVGMPMIPQRFGADFLKLAQDGGNAEGGRTELDAFHAYREPLYAVADGTVITVVDGLPDIPVGESRSHLEWEAMPGNHVVLQIADSAYALYPHLQSGSIRVTPGQPVRRGELIGRIGNSGNTTIPHLHFHVSDRPHPNASEGVPFVFREFDVVSRDYQFRADQRPLPTTGIRMTHTLPEPNTVVRFPEHR